MRLVDSLVEESIDIDEDLVLTCDVDWKDVKFR